MTDVGLRARCVTMFVATQVDSAIDLHSHVLGGLRKRAGTRRKKLAPNSGGAAFKFDCLASECFAR